MGTMKGYRIQQWGRDPVWQEMPDPQPGPGEVLVQVEACAVSLTVLNCINGDLGNDPSLLPRVPGHELVGRVIELGRDSDPALLGQRVAAYFYLSCGKCEECQAERESRCRRLGGFLGVHRDAGYAPLATLPELNAIPIPYEIDPVDATVIPDAVATPVHVCRSRVGMRTGDRAVVVGAGGGVGIHMVQMARICGAEVAAIERNEAKHDKLAELGVTPFTEMAMDQDPARLFGKHSPTVIVDLVGTPSTLAWSVRALDSGGRLAVLTTFRDVTVEVDPRELVFREFSIIGSRYCSRSEVQEAASLVMTGDIQPIVGEVVSPDSVLGLHQRLRNGTLLGRGALDWRIAA